METKEKQKAEEISVYLLNSVVLRGQKIKSTPPLHPFSIGLHYDI